LPGIRECKPDRRSGRPHRRGRAVRPAHHQLARSLGQVPVYYTIFPPAAPLDDYKEGSRDSLLPFGYGLTYAQLTYGRNQTVGRNAQDGAIARPSPSPTQAPARHGGRSALPARIRLCAGARPLRELKGFQRVTLQPGESKEVSFSLTAHDLGAGRGRQRDVEPGRFGLVIAPDSASGTMVEFTLEP